MTLFSQEDIREMCREAGFGDQDSRIASAVALCESTEVVAGTTYADSEKIGDLSIQDEIYGPSVGLFQIRSLKSQTGSGGYRDEIALRNPRHNIKSAKQIRITQGWEAWTRYRTGAYKAYLPDMFPPAPGTYRVRAGETYYGIARKLGIPATVLVGLNYNVPLDIGTVLTLPFKEHHVRYGQTLFFIARLYGTTWQKVAAYNNLQDPNMINVGDVLRIPR